MMSPGNWQELLESVGSVPRVIGFKKIQIGQATRAGNVTPTVTEVSHPETQ